LLALVCLTALPLALGATPSFPSEGPAYAVSTFHSIGLYWSPPEHSPPKGSGASYKAEVHFRPAGDAQWRKGLDLWYDERNQEYRGSIVELQPGSAYEIRLTVSHPRDRSVLTSALLKQSTWPERFPEGTTVRVPRGTTRLDIGPADSGKPGAYTVYSAPPGQNVIDGSGAAAPDASCVVINGASYVILRGLILKSCKRQGVLLLAGSHDIVIEDNDISGWGGKTEPGAGDIYRDVYDMDAAVYCDNDREKDASRKVSRIIVQGNKLHDPRWTALAWEGNRQRHPRGPQGISFTQCGTNHVIRYNDIYSSPGHFFNDGIGGGRNFSHAGFPFADSDIYGNKISEAYDDGIEAEGANRNVRIWGNYFNNIMASIANATTSVGPLYVWRNVSNRAGGMHDPTVNPDRELDRGPFVKAGGGRDPAYWGGRAYYFHNTVLQPPAPRDSRTTMGHAHGIADTGGGALYNFVSRNNIWDVPEGRYDRRPTYYCISRSLGSAQLGPGDADRDLCSSRFLRTEENDSIDRTPRFADATLGDSGNYVLAPRSPGHGAAELIPNFNDQFTGPDGKALRPDVGAHQSGTPRMKFGVAAYRSSRPDTRVNAGDQSKTD
jgi:hypothetical protein